MWTDKTNHEGYDDPTPYEALKNIAHEAKPRRYRNLIFVCSPLSGDVARNIRRARGFARFTLDQGAVPVVPHLLYPQLLDDEDPVQREIGVRCGLSLLRGCEELWAFGDRATPGMAREITIARKYGIPVHFFDEACEEVPPFA